MSSNDRYGGGDGGYNSRSSPYHYPADDLIDRREPPPLAPRRRRRRRQGRIPDYYRSDGSSGSDFSDYRPRTPTPLPPREGGNGNDVSDGYSSVSRTSSMNNNIGFDRGYYDGSDGSYDSYRSRGTGRIPDGRDAAAGPSRRRQRQQRRDADRHSGSDSDRYPPRSLYPYGREDASQSQLPPETPRHSPPPED